jgi:ribosome-associated translation inhibitor RaiA
MQKKVTARHFDLTPEMKARAEEEIDGLTRFYDRIISAEFILDTERHRRIAGSKCTTTRSRAAVRLTICPPPWG